MLFAFEDQEQAEWSQFDRSNQEAAITIDCILSQGCPGGNNHALGGDVLHFPKQALQSTLVTIVPLWSHLMCQCCRAANATRAAKTG